MKLQCLKVCPKCGAFAPFNTYFGAYKCRQCDWQDDSFGRKRQEKSGRLGGSSFFNDMNSSRANYLGK